MKIEKINENQIRCTLTRDDLANRKIKLSELAYGSAKARELFRDMIQQAHNEFGFEADNIPLMIEAIPVSPDSIILIVTKVEDPEELDTRFSRFSQFEDTTSDLTDSSPLSGADDIIDIFQKLCEAKLKSRTTKETVKEETAAAEPAVELVRLFRFSTFDAVIEAAHALNGYFDGDNTLYKDTHRRDYELILHQSGCTPESFNKICNMLSEYGDGKSFTAAGESYFHEHGEMILADHALQQLTQL